MGKQTIYRITGFFLSLAILLLGCGSTVLLYYAGQKGIDFVFTSQNLYKNAENVVRVRRPTETWYGEFMLRGWLIGFTYMLPGATGIIASLFYYKCPMIFHLVLSISLIFVGSFVHTAGAMAILMYRLFVIKGAIRHDPLLGDCIYVRDASLPLEYVDEQCLAGRKALILAIAAVSVMCLSWIFIFSEILYRAFTFSNIKRTGRKPAESSSDTQRKVPYSRRRHHREETRPSIQETEAAALVDDTVRNNRPVLSGPSSSGGDTTHLGERSGLENPGFETGIDTEPSTSSDSTLMKRRAPRAHSAQIITEMQQDLSRQDHSDGARTQECRQENNSNSTGMEEIARL